MKLIADYVRILCKDMIKNNKEWHQSDCTFGKSSELQIWTANIPIWNIDLYPKIGAFNFFEKCLIHRTIKKSRILKATKVLSELIK